MLKGRNGCTCQVSFDSWDLGCQGRVDIKRGYLDPKREIHFLKQVDIKGLIHITCSFYRRLQLQLYL